MPIAIGRATVQSLLPAKGGFGERVEGLRVSLSKMEICVPRYFLDLPSQHVSERVVFGPFAVTRGRKLLETFLDLQIFSVPERRKNWRAGLVVARNTTTPVSLDT